MLRCQPSSLLCGPGPWGTHQSAAYLEPSGQQKPPCSQGPSCHILPEPGLAQLGHQAFTGAQSPLHEGLRAQSPSKSLRSKYNASLATGSWVQAPSSPWPG